MSYLGRIPFYLHILTEFPASLNFYFNPSEQLPSPAPQAHTIIRQYAILLFVSSLVAWIFAIRPVDRTSRNVAGALASYHFAPFMRAWGRAGEKSYGKGLGGPVVHVLMHGFCLVGLGGLFLGKYWRWR